MRSHLLPHRKDTGHARLRVVGKATSQVSYLKNLSTFILVVRYHEYLIVCLDHFIIFFILVLFYIFFIIFFAIINTSIYYLIINTFDLNITHSIKIHLLSNIK